MTTCNILDIGDGTAISCSSSSPYLKIKRAHPRLASLNAGSCSDPDQSPLCNSHQRCTITLKRSQQCANLRIVTGKRRTAATAAATDAPAAAAAVEPWRCDCCSRMQQAQVTPALRVTLVDCDDHERPALWCRTCASRRRCVGCMEPFADEDVIAEWSAASDDAADSRAWYHYGIGSSGRCSVECDECGLPCPRATLHQTSTRCDLGDGREPYDCSADDDNGAHYLRTYEAQLRRVCDECVEWCVACREPVNGDVSAVYTHPADEDSDDDAAHEYQRRGQMHIMCTELYDRRFETAEQRDRRRERQEHSSLLHR